MNNTPFRSLQYVLFGVIGQVKRTCTLYALSSRRQKLGELISWAKRKRLSGPVAAYQKEQEVLDMVLAKAAMRNRLLVEVVELVRVAVTQLSVRQRAKSKWRRRR